VFQLVAKAGGKLLPNGMSEDGRIVVIPDHGSSVIVRPLLRRILRDLGLTPDDYERILEHL